MCTGQSRGSFDRKLGAGGAAGEKNLLLTMMVRKCSKIYSIILDSF